MSNENFPAPVPSTRVEDIGNLQANPLLGQGVPGVEVSQVTGEEELITGIPEHLMWADSTPNNAAEHIDDQPVPMNLSTSGEGIGPNDPRYALLMAKRQDNIDMITAAADGADLKGKRLP